MVSRLKEVILLLLSFFFLLPFIFFLFSAAIVLGALYDYHHSPYRSTTTRQKLLGFTFHGGGNQGSERFKRFPKDTPLTNSETIGFFLRYSDSRPACWTTRMDICLWVDEKKYFILNLWYFRTSIWRCPSWNIFTCGQCFLNCVSLWVQSKAAASSKPKCFLKSSLTFLPNSILYSIMHFY